MFAEDTSLFSKVKDSSLSLSEIKAPHKGSFIEKIERVQNNACLVITVFLKVVKRAPLSRISIRVAQR